MKNSVQFLVGFVFLLMAFGCGVNNVTEVPTLTNTPLPTQTPTITPTKTPKPTKTSVPTQAPIFVTLNSPYPSDCGDGIPRFWSNDSFNSIFKQAFDDHHGHVDLRPPKGCLPPFVILAPIGGTLIQHTECSNEGCYYSLVPPDNVYPTGIEYVLKYMGIENPQLKYVSNIKLDFGHLDAVVDGKTLNRVGMSANVSIAQPIGTLTDLRKIGKSGTEALAYQITLLYKGTEYMFTPSLLPQVSGEHDITFACVVNSPYDCEPEQNDYAP